MTAMIDRETWDEYFMTIARTVSTRATCDRKHVGAVIVRGKHIVSTGYNGSIIGGAHCDDVGHLMVDGHCVRTVHAEMNALVQAASVGVAVEGATLYVTAYPCHLCAKLLVNAKIARVVYDESYRVDPHAVATFACHPKMQIEHWLSGEMPNTVASIEGSLNGAI